MDDLFGNTGSIFDDIPKKPKEKKKKKATTSKENIFDEPSKGSVQNIHHIMRNYISVSD